MPLAHRMGQLLTKRKNWNRDLIVDLKGWGKHLRMLIFYRIQEKTNNSAQIRDVIIVKCCNHIVIIKFEVVNPWYKTHQQPSYVYSNEIKQNQFDSS